MASNNPYRKALEDQRAAATWQGVGTGASTGATIGSAIYPGVGTAIGGAIGAIGGGIVGAASYQDDPLQVAQMKELEKLQNRQDMDALGLTAEERALLESQLIDPMRAARREQQLQFQQAISGGDVSQGSVFKSGIGAEQRAALQDQQARVKIEEANQAEKAREEARIYELLGDETKRQEALAQVGQQTAAQIGSVAQAYQSDMAQRAQQDAFSEKEQEILSKYNNGTPEEQALARDEMAFWSSFYGGKGN